MIFTKNTTKLKAFLIYSFIAIFTSIFCAAQGINIKTAWKKTNLLNYSDLINIDTTRSAIHESGHAIIAYLSGYKINYIKFNSDNHQEFNRALAITDITYPKKTPYQTFMNFYLGGYIAEELFYTISSGGIDLDIEIATELIVNNNLDLDKNLFYNILDEQLKTARNILSEHKDLIIFLADKLLEKKYLSGKKATKLITNFLNNSKPLATHVA